MDSGRIACIIACEDDISTIFCLFESYTYLPARGNSEAHRRLYCPRAHRLESLSIPADNRAELLDVLGFSSDNRAPADNPTGPEAPEWVYAWPCVACACDCAPECE